MRHARQSTQLRRVVALVAIIALGGLTFAMSAGSRDVHAATGSSTGVVSGFGVIVVGTQTTVVSVSATYDGVNPPTGSASIETHTTGGPSASPGVSTVSCAWFSGSSVVVGGLKDGSAPYLMFITDGGPTGTSDTLEVALQPGGPDCTVGPFGGAGGSLLVQGNFAVTGGPADVAPADGIIDTLQPVGSAAGSFYDGSITPPTSGSIVSANGLSVLITDAPAPAGVAVAVGTEVPGAQAELLVCAGYQVLVDAGSAAWITCGSVTVKVTAGTVVIVLSGGANVVSIPAGGTAKVTDTGAGTFAVANLGATDVSLTVAGSTTQLSSGASTTAATATFVGFAQPVDNAPSVNRAKAGQAIPIKWRLVNGAGAPITNLGSAGLTVTSLPCSLGTTADQPTEGTAGSSGLQNLGNGYYQLNWKTPASYAGSCKTLHLRLGAVTHDTLFQFTR